MRTAKIILGLGLWVLLFSCGRSDEGQRNEEYSADSSQSGFISSSAAVETNKDTTRKFIRTADLKFKVKSVIKSTYHIEDLTNRMGGFVTYTNLKSNIDYVTTTAISADSSLETTYYVVTNAITLRVPNTLLDTVLKEIAKNIDFLDHRIIKAEDVALQILSNQLTQKRSSKNEERLSNAIGNSGKEPGAGIVADAILSGKQERGDLAKINNLSLADQINFSTINLFIYERQTIKRELISNNVNIDEYEPGFGSKLVEALKKGWEILEAVFVSLAELWGLFLFGLIAWLVYRRYRHLFNKKPPTMNRRE